MDVVVFYSAEELRTSHTFQFSLVPKHLNKLCPTDHPGFPPKIIFWLFPVRSSYQFFSEALFILHSVCVAYQRSCQVF